MSNTPFQTTWKYIHHTTQLNFHALNNGQLIRGAPTAVITNVEGNDDAAKILDLNKIDCTFEMTGKHRPRNVSALAWIKVGAAYGADPVDMGAAAVFATVRVLKSDEFIGPFYVKREVDGNNPNGTHQYRLVNGTTGSLIIPIRAGGSYSILFLNPLQTEYIDLKLDDYVSVGFKLSSVNPAGSDQNPVDASDFKILDGHVEHFSSINNDIVDDVGKPTTLTRVQLDLSTQLRYNYDTIPMPSLIKRVSRSRGVFSIIQDAEPHTPTKVISLQLPRSIPDGEYKIKGDFAYFSYVAHDFSLPDVRRNDISGIHVVKNNQILLDNFMDEEKIDDRYIIPGQRMTEQVLMSNQVGGPVSHCIATYTSEPFVQAEIVVGDLKTNYNLDCYREETYTKRFSGDVHLWNKNAAVNDYTDSFGTVRFNDIRVLEGFHQAILYCTVAQDSFGFELKTALGDTLLGMDLLRVQFNGKNCLLDDTPESFLFDEFKKSAGDRYSFKQWRETKQMFVFNNETLGIDIKPGQATMSNLSIDVRPKLSKYWKNLKKSTNFPTDRGESVEGVGRKNLALNFKCVLVLVYKNRAISISENGNVEEQMRNINYSQTKPQEPKVTVPIASGGNALSYLQIN